VLGVDSRILEDDSSEFEDEDDPMKDESEKSSGDLSEDEDRGEKSKGLKLKMPLSDSSEDEEEVEPVVDLKSTKLSSDSIEDEEGMVGIESSLNSLLVEDSNPMTGIESNQTDSSEQLAELFQLRRSVRNAAQKHLPTPKLLTGGKMSSGKRKPAPKNVDILLEASVQYIACNIP
jgi:hypothetical protein